MVERMLRALAWMGCVCLVLQAMPLAAATIALGDVTAVLGPTFFVDEASSGGSDATINQPAVGSYARDFSGLLVSNQGPSQLVFAGFGFATSTSALDNDATSLAVSLTYLGADGLPGGGDDVFIGTATGNYLYTTNGEYAFAFDAPIITNLNITGVRFLIQVAPSNAGGNGSVRFKTGALAYEGTTGPKFSIAGSAVGRRLNLAKYQAAVSSTTNGAYWPDYAADGVVGNDNSWRSGNVSTAHWVELDFPTAVKVASAQVYSGVDDGALLANFKLQYYSGANWLDVPGGARTGNASPEVNVIFSNAVSASQFRLYSDDNGNQRVKELALFPPNPNPTNGAEQGFRLGMDVELNLAHQRPVVATASAGSDFPKLAVDGFVNGASRWRTTLVGSNALEIDLRATNKIGSVHLYSGDTNVPVITNFLLQYWNGSAWTNFAGGAITNNLEPARVVSFSPEATSSRVRLVFTNPAVSVVRELCVFPANGGAGYPLGQEVTGAQLQAWDWESYSDAFYQLRNRAANLAACVASNGPSLGATNGDAQLSQYQLLLNTGTDTYRLRNRVTGRCLSGAGLATDAGALLREEDYAALPHQHWRKVNCDATDFYLVNAWSGLAIDTQQAGVAAGTALVQNACNGATSQRWRAIFQALFPRKGLALGSGVTNAAAYVAYWAYSWGRTPSGPLASNVVFNPMQWGDQNLDLGSRLGPLEQYRSDWQREGQAAYLLGFNEPDGLDQANLTVDEVLSLWPRLERMNRPLVSPAPKSAMVSWMTNFMTQADANGCRIDAVATHKYPGPAGGDPSGMLSELQTAYNTYGRPVWLTEFSTVDWNGNGSWTEEDNYNWLAEFLWRAESLPWLRRYSLFLFTVDTNHPAPVNPWDQVAPRSNAFQEDGVTPTPFGELYFAWDCDANVRTNTAYFIHNQTRRKRLANALSSSAPSESTIRSGTNTTQWVLRAAPAAGQYYITSLRDGRRLRRSGTTVDFAPLNTTGTAVTWTLVEDQYGWFYLENPAAPNTSRRLQDNGGTFSMGNVTNTAGQFLWRFVVPLSPVYAQLPVPPINVVALAGTNQISLAWASGGTPGAAYWIYRATNSGGGYSLLASNLSSLGYVDASAAAGKTYYYVLTSQDAFGNESAYSAEASATSLSTLPTAPTKVAYAVSNRTLVLNWPTNYTGWVLVTTTNALSKTTNTPWTVVPGSQDQSTFQAPLDPAIRKAFFRLMRP